MVIVGAGLAGLSCAYRLAHGGVTASIYEASARVGGRTLSTRPGCFPDGQTGELGGEFIDSGHLTMHALARELAIPLDDRRVTLDALHAEDVWWLSGARITESALLSQLMEVAQSISEQSIDAQRNPATFSTLDRTSLANWLEHNVAARELRAVLGVAYRGEYGAELTAQSALNLVLFIGTSTERGLQPFGDSDERYRASQGNQVFATKLAHTLQRQLRYHHELLSIRGDARNGYLLRFQHGEQIRDVEADVVVLAIPFTTLRRVDLRALDLTGAKSQLIAELGYGQHIKMLDAFRRRTWSEDFAASGSVISDEPFQQLWDTSLGQHGVSGILTTFLAGAEAETRKPVGWTEQVFLRRAGSIFPGLERDHIAGSTLQMHWASQPHVRASYACYRPGQWAQAGQEGQPELDGTLHFCGEHASVDYQGFMEGAAESGMLVAGSILKQLGRAADPAHAALLHVKRCVAQPAFREACPGHTRPERALRIALSLRELAKLA